MIYTIISDIHGNLAALEAFFDFCKKNGLKLGQVICAGDLVGYGPSPSECIRLVSSITETVISGNHERMLLDEKARRDASNLAVTAIEWVDEHINHGDREFIRALPESLSLDPSLLVVHGSPLDPDEYIFSSATALRSIAELRRIGKKRVVIGHTHVPGIFDGAGTRHYSTDTEFNLLPEEYYIINPGSIGQPRDGDPRASFCIMDTQSMLVKFYRIPYDIQRTADHITREGLPGQLAQRLFHGI